MSIAEKFEIIADEVYEAGKKAEYDAFWDSFQNNGSRVAYQQAFREFKSDIFKPKYDMNVTRLDYAFMNLFKDNMVYGYSLKKALEDCKVTLNTANCTNMDYAFYYSYVNETGVIDTRSANSLNGVFANTSLLHTINKLILKADGSQTFSGVFTDSPKLQNLVIEGVIGKNGFDIHWSTELTKASITSIINALSDSTTGKTLTLSKTAKEAAFTADEWSKLIATKSNWTISLV